MHAARTNWPPRRALAGLSQNTLSERLGHGFLHSSVHMLTTMPNCSHAGEHHHHCSSSLLCTCARYFYL
jgi:hypothetical protein